MRAIGLALAALLACGCEQRTAATAEVAEAAASPLATSAPAPSVALPLDASVDVAEAGAAADASSEAGARDARLRQCCSRFGPYATGYVADRGPNLNHIEAKCIELWKAGKTLAEAEPELRVLVKKANWYLTPDCKASP